MPISLMPKLLSKAEFAPYGDVIETDGADSYAINNGSTMRFHDLARVETLGAGARSLVSIFLGDAFELPVDVTMMERHPLGSQAFFPLQPLPWLVVVAKDNGGKPHQAAAFLVLPQAGQLRGVNYHRNVWHHPLISLEAPSRFLVVDRGGEGKNLEEHFFAESYRVSALPAT